MGQQKGEWGCEWLHLTVDSPLFCLCTYYYYYLFGAALGLPCGTQAFSIAASRGQLFIVVPRFLLAVAALVGEHRLKVHGLSCSKDVESFRTRDQTCVSSVGRQLLLPCATREILKHVF